MGQALTMETPLASAFAASLAPCAAQGTHKEGKGGHGDGPVDHVHSRSRLFLATNQESMYGFN
jgi:hypothetical protein